MSDESNRFTTASPAAALGGEWGFIMRLLDPRFRYVPAAQTDVLSTWRRFGYRPTSDAERRARLSAPESIAPTAPVRSDIDLRSPRSGRDKRRRPGLKLVAE